MKYLQSCYIIIRGPLGVGKTTIAKLLAKTLNAKYISIDKVLAQNGLDKAGADEGYIPLRNCITANKVVLPKAKSALRRGKIIVFDGNFYYKKQIQHLIIELQEYNCYVFTLKATLATCTRRDSQRKKPYGKDAVQAVYRAASRFGYGTNVKTGYKTRREIVKEILARVAKRA